MCFWVKCVNCHCFLIKALIVIISWRNKLEQLHCKTQKVCFHKLKNPMINFHRTCEPIHRKYCFENSPANRVRIFLAWRWHAVRLSLLFALIINSAWNIVLGLRHQLHRCIAEVALLIFIMFADLPVDVCEQQDTHWPKCRIHSMNMIIIWKSATFRFTQGSIPQGPWLVCWNKETYKKKTSRWRESWLL